MKMKAATERKRRHQFQAVAPVAIVANAILIIHQHMIHAEAIFQWNNDTSDSGVFDNQTLNAVGVNRFRSFDELTDLDFVFLGCLLMLGLELNNFVIKIFGDAMKRSTIPVRGAHLDDFSPVSISSSFDRFLFKMRYHCTSPDTSTIAIVLSYCRQIFCISELTKHRHHRSFTSLHVICIMHRIQCGISLKSP